MIDISAKDLNIIKTILSKYVPNTEVHVYGSRVSGKAKKFSDLDLAIVGENKLSFATIGDLQNSFESAETSVIVDFHDWHRISEEFRAIINQEYEIIRKGRMNS